ncbi:MAG: hypothetical protein ACI8PB_002610 [Desulforhopalus sp.]|jgi:hypothetical protein
MEKILDKRKNSRIKTKDLTVDVSDGKRFFSGTADDISILGICLIDMAKKLGKDADKYTIIISGHGKSFRLEAHPKWETEEGLTKKIGVEIANVPRNWIEFVENFKPKHDDDDDVWGNRTLK